VIAASKWFEVALWGTFRNSCAKRRRFVNEDLQRRQNSENPSPAPHGIPIADKQISQPVQAASLGTAASLKVLEKDNEGQSEDLDWL